MLRQFLPLFSGSAIGKIIGVLREILFAAFFGTSSITDAYRAVFTATISFSHLFTSEALNAAFIPQFRKYHADMDPSAWSLFNGIGLLLCMISVIAGSIMYFFAPTLISLLLPGFRGEQFGLAVRMLQIMAWGVPFYILSALLIYLEIGSKQFHLVTLRPFVQNLGVIIALILAFLSRQPVWIAWGFTGTYLVFSLFGLTRLIRKSILTRRFYRYWNNIQTVAKRFWLAMRPMAFFSVLMQTNILLEKAIASLIGPGAVAAIDYARLIPETAQVLIIVPLGLVSLSAMVSLHEHEVKEQSDRMSAMVLMLFVPLSGLAMISAPYIIHLVYMRGAFNESSVFLTAQALKGMAVGMWAVCLAYVLQKVYNARIRNREVLRIGAMGILTNAIFNIIMYKYLGVMAIGLGFSLGGIIMVWFYVRGMGGLKKTGQTARICLLAVVPYGIIAFLIDNARRWTPPGGLIVQMSWTVIFWAAIFWLFPPSRDILQHLMRKVLSMRERR